jgi:hypothetical protein
MGSRRCVPSATTSSPSQRRSCECSVRDRIPGSCREARGTSDPFRADVPSLRRRLWRSLLPSGGTATIVNREVDFVVALRLAPGLRDSRGNSLASAELQSWPARGWPRCRPVAVVRLDSSASAAVALVCWRRAWRTTTRQAGRCVRGHGRVGGRHLGRAAWPTGRFPPADPTLTATAPPGPPDPHRPSPPAGDAANLSRRS